jgi:hypothetical protein
MKKLTRRILLKTMVELLKNRKPSSSSYQAGYEDALRDLAAEFKLSMKDGEAKWKPCASGIGCWYANSGGWGSKMSYDEQSQTLLAQGMPTEVLGPIIVGVMLVVLVLSVIGIVVLANKEGYKWASANASRPTVGTKFGRWQGMWPRSKGNWAK